jgi:hypothetical protein
MFARAQGAVEFLTTYAWMILVVVVVLAVLFLLGVFSGFSVGTFCTPQAGFTCSVASLASDGYLSISIGYASLPTLPSGESITITGIGCSSSSSEPSSFASESVSLSSGQSNTLRVQCLTTAQNPIGTKFQGTVWIKYSTPSASGLTSEVGVVGAAVGSYSTTSSTTTIPPLQFSYATNFLAGTSTSPSISLASGNTIYFCALVITSVPVPTITSQSWTTAITGTSNTIVGYQSSSTCSATLSSSASWAMGIVGVNENSYTFVRGGSGTASSSITVVTGGVSANIISIGTMIPTVTTSYTGCVETTDNSWFYVFVAFCPPGGGPVSMGSGSENYAYETYSFS